MKTSVDIPEKELLEAMKHSGAKTKKEAIIAAVTDFNRRQRLFELTRELGTFENLMTVEELDRQRQDKP